MVEWATEVKVRAERRTGQLLKETAERGERATKDQGGSGSNQHKQVSHRVTPAPTLADLGISRNELSRYQQLAADPLPHRQARAKYSDSIDR